MARVPRSPSTSVPSCSQVPSSPAPIKLNWLKRRDKDTLLPIIRAYILPGTRMTSDKWKAYDCLQDKGYQHLTVNHSLNFVDPYTGAHTQGTIRDFISRTKQTAPNKDSTQRIASQKGKWRKKKQNSGAKKAKQQKW